ncbi:MAG: oligosaccharide flippase family protein [Acidobacteria bacterium]|nr:oligosaccharide flippase family protein [Acidobacteriota bacterium]
MQLRYVLAADADGAVDFAAAAHARLLTSLLATALLAGGAWLLATPETVAVVALLALTRAVEDAGGLLLGLAQRSDAWELIARSLALRGLGGAAAFGATLLLRPSLPLALTATLVWQVAVTLGHDWPATRHWAGPWSMPPRAKTLEIIRTHAALGAAAALVSLNAYIPRYTLERTHGLETVAVFTALSQLALAGNMLVQAVGQAAVAPLSRAYGKGPRAFAGKLAGLLLFAALAGAAGLAAAAIFGERALTLLYRPEYAAHAGELVWLMIAAGLMYATAVLGYALMASGERQRQLQAFALSSAVALAASWALTPGWGVRGACWALAAAWLTAAAALTIALALRILPWRRAAASRKLSQWIGQETPRAGAAR